MIKTVFNKKLCLMDFCVPLVIIVSLLLFVYRNEVLSFVGMNEGFEAQPRAKRPRGKAGRRQRTGTRQKKS